MLPLRAHPSPLLDTALVARAGAPRSRQFHRRAFTLLEVLVAVAIFAIVLAAINTVFYSALRLRQKTVAALQESLPVHQALNLLRRDLQGALPPGQGLAASFRVGAVGTGLVLAQNMGLEFFTSTGALTDTAPWGEVQKVTYQLLEPLNSGGTNRLDLVRSVTRNLLSTVAEEPLDQWLLSNVQTLEFACFDGTEWRDTWDTTLGQTGLPQAVLVRILTAPQALPDHLSPVLPGDLAPIELIVPLLIQARTNQTETTQGQP